MDAGDGDFFSTPSGEAPFAAISGEPEPLTESAIG